MEQSLNLWTKMNSNTELYTQRNHQSSFNHAWSQKVCLLSILCQKAPGESLPPKHEHQQKMSKAWASIRRDKGIPRTTMKGDSRMVAVHQERGKQVQAGAVLLKRRACWRLSSTCPKTLYYLFKVINATKRKKSVKKDKDKSCHKHKIQLWTKAKRWEQRNIQGQHNKRPKEQAAQKRRERRSPGNCLPEIKCEEEMSLYDHEEKLLRGYWMVWGK